MINRASLWVLMKLRNHEEGQAAAEYGVLLALILVVSITVIAVLGTDIKSAFTSITSAL